MHFVVPSLVILIVATRGYPEDTGSVEEVHLPTPKIYGISRFEEEGPTIHWILNDESEDKPVTGYKVKLWQVGCDKKPKYKIINGQRVRLRNVMPKLRDFSTLRNLTEFTLEGKSNTSLWLKDIESDVPYHMTVAARGTWTDEGVGPDSSPFRFQYRGSYICREI